MKEAAPEPEPEPAPSGPCRGSEIDIHAIATGKLCPLAEVTPARTLEASIPEQTRPPDFDWITVELKNPGAEPVTAAINPAMAMAAAGIAGIADPGEAVGYAVTIEPGGVARLRVRCGGRCVRDPSAGSARLRVYFVGRLGKIVRRSTISGTIAIEGSRAAVGTGEPEQPRIVPSTALLSQLISGDKDPAPDPITAKKLRESRRRAIAVYKVCVDALGAVSGTQKLRSSGYTTYDLLIEAAVREWKLRPFEINGRAVPVCSVRTFVGSAK